MQIKFYDLTLRFLHIRRSYLCGAAMRRSTLGSPESLVAGGSRDAGAELPLVERVAWPAPGRRDCRLCPAASTAPTFSLRLTSGSFF